MIQNENKKIAFTIRIDQKTKDTLEKVSNLERTKLAMVARNYLNLSNFIIRSTNLEIKSYDNRDLTLIPKEFLSEMIKNLSLEGQYEWADRVGILINSNAGFSSNNSIETKIDILKGFNFIDIRDVGGYYGFSSNHYTVEFVNALLYRLFHNNKYPKDKWTRDFITQYLTVNFNDLDKKTKKDYTTKGIDKNIQDFKNELGGLPGNYSPNTQYYKFSTLKT